MVLSESFDIQTENQQNFHILENQVSNGFPPKYASLEKILEVKTSKTKLDVKDAGQNFIKLARLPNEKLEEGEDGYIYVRANAISSRVNKNKDGWPAEELARAYKTFIGRPIFVDHNNDDPKRARGVVIDARLHVDDEKSSALDPYYSSAPKEHLPPTRVEIIMEVDAKTFPKLAEHIENGRIDATSMGANIESSVCSICSNTATAPSEYCEHIEQKGTEFEIEGANGEKVRKMAYEDCYGVNFFEDSFVFDPADETALIGEHSQNKLSKEAEHNPILDLMEEDERRRDEGGDEFAVGEIVDLTEGRGQVEIIGERYNSSGDTFYKVRLVNYPFDPSREGEEFGIRPTSLLKREQKDAGLLKEAPNKKHVDAWSPKRNRQYEHILESCKSEHPDWSHDRCKELAARTVNKTRKKKNETKSNVREAFDPAALGVSGLVGMGLGAAARYLWNYFKGRGMSDQDVLNEVSQELLAQGFRPEEVRAELNLRLNEHGMDERSVQYKSKIADKDLSQYMRPVQEEKGNKGEKTPQSEQVTAPQDVDTLREEPECPICRADVMKRDPDGVTRCPTCGHEAEPEPFDNPDLEKAREVDVTQDEEGVVNEEEKERATPIDPIEEVQPLSSIYKVPLVKPERATKIEDSTEIISDMFTVKARADSKELIDRFVPKKAAVVETTVGFRGGIHFGTYAALKAAGITDGVTITYPDGNQTTPPNGNPMAEFMYSMKNQQELGLSNPAEVPITVEAPDDQIDQVIEIIHAGGGGMGGPGGGMPGSMGIPGPSGPPRGAAARKRPSTTKRPLAPASQTSEEEKVVTDQLRPIESGIIEIDGIEYELTPVSDNVKREADRRHIKRQEEELEGGGIKRTEEIIEEDGEPTSESTGLLDEEIDKQEPVAEESETETTDKEEYSYANVKEETERQILARLALAELAVDMGVLPSEEKLAFIGQLEDETEEQIAARQATLEMVKGAGLVSRKSAVVSGVRNEITRMPRFSGVRQTTNETIDEDDAFQAIFL